MSANRVCASEVLSTKDLKMRTEQELTEIVARFLTVGEGVVGHWVEYARGLLLFVMAPGDDRSGEFYVYDRKHGSFWLLALADRVFGGYSITEMGPKIREFRLLDFAENPARLLAARRS
jgi:hypothetical protein